jgi:hypothetical protein
MIVRSKQKSRGFYMLENSLSNDPGISWAAKGMLVFLLAKPDDWTVCVEALVNFTKPASPRNDGKTAVYAIIKELVAAGYMTKHKHQNGTLDYMVYDERQVVDSAPDSGNTNEGIPQIQVSPKCENPDLGFPPLVKTDLEVKTVKALPKTKVDELPTPPEWLDPKAWGDWLQHRKEKGKPVTPLSATKSFTALRGYLDAGHTAQACIDHSIAGGYQGIFAPTNTTRKVANAVKSRHTVAAPGSYGETTTGLPF